MRFLIVTVIIFVCFLQVIKANLITLASLASQGDCEFYKELEKDKNCGANGYPIAYGYKYCQKFGVNINNFNDDGKKWVDSVRKCLMSKLLNNQMVCKQLEDYAFETHVDCYLNPGYGSKSICDIWASQNAVGLLSTYELKDFFKNFSALSQVFTTMGQCVLYYGNNVLQILLNTMNGLGSLIG